ncbi:MAG TPA: hypothetical protein VEZ89_12350 [Rubrivivax sp.]|nr:hypothetical protein [Rubrivivax sp.]
MWQAGDPEQMHFHHLGTRIASDGEDQDCPAGQTVWAATGSDGEAGMAWDWIQIARGVVAIADPMAVVTNVRFVGPAGEVLTAQQAALFLNALVGKLPWQQEVHRALSARVN